MKSVSQQIYAARSDYQDPAGLVCEPEPVGRNRLPVACEVYTRLCRGGSHILDYGSRRNCGQTDIRRDR